MPAELPTAPAATRILVIKLGALGDVVLAFAPFAAIRAHHPDAHVTLLTTAPFLGLASASPWFDAVAIDSRPAFWNLRGLGRLRRLLSGFDLVYDLQTSGRSSRYHRLAGRPSWSGIAPGCSLPDRDPDRDRLHTRRRQAGQLAQAGIPAVPDPDLSWLAAHGAMLPAPLPPASLPSTRLALLVPGAAPHRPAKRWPAERFGVLASRLAAAGMIPVVLGTGADAPLADAIRRICPAALDLTGRTTLLELGRLASRAALAVGNDTGPMHLAAAMGCSCLVLFSNESDPVLSAPVGRRDGQVQVLRVPDLSTLDVATVVGRLGPGLEVG